MDSFELNKIFGAVLAVLFLILGVSFLSEGLFESHKPEKPGFIIEVAEDDGHSSGGAEKKKAGPEPIAALLADADIEAGKKVAKKCAACHSFDKGGASKVGPNLYEIVNKPIAGVSGFGYSTAMTDYAAGQKWDYDQLNKFLFKPKALIKGTAMGFAGLKKTKDRANIIGYLRSLADSPAELPAAE